MWFVLCLSHFASATASRFLARHERFLIASFPRLKQVNYAVLPNPTWRPLILGQLIRPEAVVVDPETKRLFVADSLANAVYWYQLQILSPGRLMTDGRRHVVMKDVMPRGIAVDMLGVLYIAGRHEPLPPESPSEGVFKAELDDILRAGPNEPFRKPEMLWGKENTALADGSGSQLMEPCGLAVDPFHIFWGNLAREGPTGASVVKATSKVPALNPEGALMPLADNADEVQCLTLTPTNVYYAAGGKVYGVPKGKESSSCGVDGVLCPVVSYLDSGQVLEPTSMVWDGDGSVFLADQGSASIYAFAAGTLSPHVFTKVADGRGVHGLTVFSDMMNHAFRIHGTCTVLIWAVIAFAAMWSSSV